MEGCLDLFFDNTIVAFGFWDMLLRICKVHGDSKLVEHCILEQVEFVVLSNLGDLESSFVVDSNNFLECFFISNNQLAFNILSNPVL
jgi:hypothetical protein